MELEQAIKEQLEILQSKNRDEWNNSKYELLKTSGNTPKGTFGEELFCSIMRSLGHTAEVINNGIGEFDVIVDDDIRVECKLATGIRSFQFNGIKKKIDYDYVFCLGVTPNQLYFKIQSHKWCKKNLKIKMGNKSSVGYKHIDSYKYVATVGNMIELNEETKKGIIFE